MTWSTGLYRLLGIDPAEPVSLRLFAELLHPDDRDNWSDPLDLLVHGGFSRDRFRVLRRDGSMRRLAGRTEVIYRAPGDPTQVLGLVRDVTAEDAANATARQMRRRFDLLASVLAVESWLAAPDGTVTLDAAMTAVPCPGGDSDRVASVKCQDWLEAVHPDDRVRVRETWRRANADGERYDARYRARRADGAYEPVRSQALPLRTDAGAIEMWVGAVGPDPSAVAPRREPLSPSAVSPAQVRAARGLLSWSLADLAAAAGVSLSTVRRAEATGFGSIGEAGRVAIMEAFQRQGVVFHDDGNGRQGVSYGR